MVIFTGLFTAFGRLIGSVAAMAIAWAMILLFGRVPQSRQTVLAFIALGAAVWVVAILGVLVPAVGNLLVSSVPQTSVIKFSWLRWTMLGLAAFLPAAVGLATVPLLPEDSRSRARTVVQQGLLGYLYTAVFAVMLLFLGLWGLVRRVHSLKNQWESAHIPMIVKPGRYEAVVRDIEAALHDAGFEVVRTRAAPWLRVPPRLVAAMGRQAVKGEIPDELVEFHVDDLGILVYPFDVALLGPRELVAPARALIARRLAIADAYLTSARESEQIEDRLADLSRMPRSTGAEFAPIDKELDSLVMPYDQWETLYWLRLQAEHDASSSRAGQPAGSPQRVPARAPRQAPTGVATSTR
jgi:hypothetical protein